MTTQAAWLVRSNVMHARKFPQRYRFDYKIIGFFLDIDHLDTLAKQHWFFSMNRFNLFSLYTHDHAARNGGDWRNWIEEKLHSRGIIVDGGRIRLLTIPRILGYAFNPLSIWYCECKEGELRAVVLEVRNTFGEHHHYVLDADGAPLTWPVRGKKQKNFHVSPFIDMHAQYSFHLRDPDQGPAIRIKEYQQNQLMLLATQTCSLLPFSDRSMLLEFLRMPLISLKVLFLIHWQALFIWFRGGKYHPKPAPPEREMS